MLTKKTKQNETQKSVPIDLFEFKASPKITKTKPRRKLRGTKKINPIGKNKKKTRAKKPIYDADRDLKNLFTEPLFPPSSLRKEKNTPQKMYLNDLGFKWQTDKKTPSLKGGKRKKTRKKK